MTEPAHGHEKYQGMLSIHYTTPTGVVAIRFRKLDDSQPKYLGLEGQKTRLFNVQAFEEAGHSIAICEGEIDTLTLHCMVGIPAVGVAGVQSWKEHYPRMFDGFETAYVFADNDIKADGSNPGRELFRKISQEVSQAQLVLLPAGSDVNELYVLKGARAVLDLLPANAT